jgi:hypothetical protein
MADIKHVGRIVNNGRKCIVVFRTLPGDAFSALVVMTESLSESYHDSLINLVESNAAQVSNELSEVLARAVFSDGSTMLPSLHVKGLLTKVPTSQVEMTPNSSANILLSQLNQLIAEQRGVSVQDLAIQPDAPNPDAEVKEIASAKDISPKQGNTDPIIDQTISEPLNDEQLAKKYRSDADRLSKEAAQLRRMAEELVPTKKKVVTAE